MKTMNFYENHLNGLTRQVSQLFAINGAIRTIKDNPGKYPEFKFWAPGYDAEGWTDKAISDFNELMPDLRQSSIIFKLVFMRHYRKLSQKFHKNKKADFIGGTEFCEELVRNIIDAHPEFSKK